MDSEPQVPLTSHTSLQDTSLVDVTRPTCHSTCVRPCVSEFFRHESVSRLVAPIAKSDVLLYVHDSRARCAKVTRTQA